ncbi:TPA_exp: Uncharacterized protein A8136_1907 [Trichophyton benhamiae CBS 112371]|uniref:Uncharacterized protein n=2 Tax=Trichophyton TaxID=5550 RepID=D4AXM1_ARTBC|nr:uncharacterized protein ARB_00940 [Trichophyton benhamiae CBS 112371]XP_003025089.1 uncharacterized protein TRV_00747 [Trichophyton verrucosum HKI 0517]EFE32049.1 hypothetical protein ARB_00940 [Trichophyton benhamiae CBS 112371]EFE44478.1 hypothetical protein TRV_00747 [Trichophyton verrucosum HKI 0517]DAA75156.1 TPA_exp: Uncharacterized protein A8136_1907 [Trichophyton benhamiae CBS 112371]
MSKTIDATKTLFKNIKNGAAKFSAFITEGARIIPSKNKDHLSPLRIDAGKYDPVTKMLNVVLQVNANPKSKGLEAWLKKYSTHAKLATAKFNTAAEDQQAEYHRVLDELTDKGKRNLKDMKTADDE